MSNYNSIAWNNPSKPKFCKSPHDNGNYITDCLLTFYWLLKLMILQVIVQSIKKKIKRLYKGEVGIQLLDILLCMVRRISCDYRRILWHQSCNSCMFASKSDLSYLWEIAWLAVSLGIKLFLRGISWIKLKSREEIQYVKLSQLSVSCKICSKMSRENNLVLLFFTL